VAYDPENIFAKILRGEIPNNTVYEDEHVLAFHDINPQAPVHVLVIPKGPYENMAVFGTEASAEEQAALVQGVAKVARLMEVEDPGFRIISNNGPDGIQEVPHLHIHVLGGRRLGGMLRRPSE
jgi:histidine triad (HIT) family protein